MFDLDFLNKEASWNNIQSRFLQLCMSIEHWTCSEFQLSSTCICIPYHGIWIRYTKRCTKCEHINVDCLSNCYDQIQWTLNIWTCHLSSSDSEKMDQIEHRCENEQKRNGNLYFMSGKSDKTMLEIRAWH